METYWGFHAEQIGFTDFWRFAWQRRADLWRYLRWAERMNAKARPCGSPTDDRFGLVMK
jgi:hypothetical protein